MEVCVETANPASQAQHDAESGAEIIDFTMQRPGGIRRIFLLAIIILVCAVVGSVVLALSAALVESWFPAIPPVIRFGIQVALLLVVAAIAGVPWWVIHRRRVWTRAFDASQLSIQQVLPRFLGLKWREPNPNTLQMIAYALVGWDRVGHTLRVFMKQEPWPVTPLRETFEPEPLNEGASSFGRLSASASGMDDERGDEQSSIRRMRRRTRLAGGKFVIAAAVVLLLVGGFNLYAVGTASVLIWGLLALVMNVFGARGSITSRQQLFLVPGAVVVRRAGALQDNWHLHMFTRSTAILILHETSMRGWMVLLADIECCETAFATRREVETLLRAWTSPLPPPPEERLVDLL